jgi:hypothetical protein
LWNEGQDGGWDELVGEHEVGELGEGCVCREREQGRVARPRAHEQYAAFLAHVEPVEGRRREGRAICRRRRMLPRQNLSHLLLAHRREPGKRPILAYLRNPFHPPARVFCLSLSGTAWGDRPIRRGHPAVFALPPLLLLQRIRPREGTHDPHSIHRRAHILRKQAHNLAFDAAAQATPLPIRRHPDL